IQADDTTARHGGKNGFCTHVGNDLFAYFSSTDSKTRINFLQVLRGGRSDCVINDEAVAYWRRQKLAQAAIAALLAGAREFNDAHRQQVEQVRTRIWELYKRLKAYRQAPAEAQRKALEKEFDELVGQRTGYPSIDGVLKEMAAHRAGLLRVLERPELPPHNNL